MQKKILILGGNGMIGHKMYQTLSNTFPDTWVLLRQKLEKVKGAEIFSSDKVIESVDLTEFEQVRIILQNIDPDVIVNAAGITIRRGINDRISKSILVNAALPHFIEEWVNGKQNKRVIHFSTDCVFSGKDGAYLENSELDAQDTYGRTKAMGEISGPQSLTLRGSMIGRELDYHTELLEWFLAQENKSVKGFSNVIYSGITTVRMALFVRDIILHFPSMSGVYNVSSMPVSKYELLHLFKRVFSPNVEISEDQSYASRKDLVSGKFYNETGFSIPRWEDLAKELYEDSILNSVYYKN